MSNLSTILADNIPTAQITQLCKAAGDPLRMQILRVLQQNSYGVLELCQVFNIRQSAMSHHLKIMASAGLVSKRREGTTLFYRRNLCNPHDQLQELQAMLFKSLDRLSLSDAISAQLDRINAERSAASVAFFNANATRFEANQDLIASWSDYGEGVENLLDTSVLNRSIGVEIGPGYGQFLSKLSTAFERVIALDSSAEMLEQCRQRATSQNLPNIQLLHGDTTLAKKLKLQADCLSMNMVLHHNPLPAQIIADCAALLNPGGILLITDLCAHNQQWTKDSCGDLWMGFEPAQLSDWARSAGLVDGSSLYLAQRNGFRVQLRLFVKPQAAPIRGTTEALLPI